jgi:hypothetical protein
MSNKLKGGLSDGLSLMDICKKHNNKNKYDNDKLYNHLKKELKNGIKVELEHTNDPKIAKEIAMDHLYEDFNYYKKLKKMEATESTGADASGSFVGNLTPIIKRKINKIPNFNLSENEEIKEIIDSSSSGAYDVPFGDGKKNPLKINGVKSIAKSRAVKDKKFPKWGGPGGVFIKIKDKCKKFPYCNQGDINAIEILREVVKEVSEETKLPVTIINNLLITEINQIFINYERTNK